MAPYPTVPDTNDPNYLGYSEPIKSFDLKSTAGQIFKSIGDTVGDVVKGAGEVVQASARQDARDTFYPARQEFEGAVTVGKNYAEYLQAGGTKIDPDKLPPEVKKLGSQLQTLDGARASKGGRLAETDFYGRMAVLAKDLRGRYPAGFSDYIDNQVAGILGVDPANAHIKGVIADINKLITGAEDTKKLAEHTVLKAALEGDSGSQNLWTQYKAGVITLDQMVSKQSENKNWEYKLDRNKKETASVADNRSLFLKNSESDANEEGSHIATDFWRQLPTQIPGLIDPKTGQLNTDVAGEQKTQDLIRSKMALARTQLEEMINRDQEGGSYVKRHGAEWGTKFVDANLKKFRDIMGDITDKDIGSAGAAGRFTDRLTKSDVLDQMMGKKGDVFRRLAIYRELSGNQADVRELLRTTMGDGTLTSDMVRISKMKTGSNEPNKPESTQHTLAEAVDELSKQGITSPKAYNELVDYVANVTDPELSDRVKLSKMLAVVGAKNNDLVSKITDVPSKYSIFNRLTDTDYLFAIKEMDAKTGGKYQLAEKHKAWVETSFKQELFPMELKYLEDNFKNKANEWDIKYSTVNHRFESKYIGPEVQSRLSTASRLQGGTGFDNPSINRLNQGLAGLENVAKSKGLTGENIDTYILKNFSDTGMMDHGMDWIAKMPGLPGSVARAITIATTDHKAREQARKLEEERFNARGNR